MVRPGAVERLADRHALSPEAERVLLRLVLAADWRTGTVHAFTVTDWADVLRTSRRRLTAALLELEGLELIARTRAGGHEGSVEVLAYDELVEVERARQVDAEAASLARRPARRPARNRRERPAETGPRPKDLRPTPPTPPRDKLTSPAPDPGGEGNRVDALAAELRHRVGPFARHRKLERELHARLAEGHEPAAVLDALTASSLASADDVGAVLAHRARELGRPPRQRALNLGGLAAVPEASRWSAVDACPRCTSGGYELTAIEHRGALVPCSHDAAAVAS